MVIKSSLILICILSSAQLYSAQPANITGAPKALSTAQAEVTLYVSPDAQPGGDGLSPQRAVPTVTAGMMLAVAELEKGKSTRLLLAPGTYRDAGFVWDLEFNNDSLAVEPLFIIEGAPGAKVILSGSDLFNDGWNVVGDGTVSHDWTYNMGEWQSWGNYGPKLPIGWRHEQVFVDGKRYNQVLSREALKPGTFFVDEGDLEKPDGQLFIKPDGALKSPQIEVSVRPSSVDVKKVKGKLKTNPDGFRPLLGISGKNNLVLRNLNFEHSNNILQHGICNIKNGENILIENCNFTWNNGIGLTMSGSKNVTVQKCNASDNGSLGMWVWALENSVWENNVTNRNNLRGFDAGYFNMWVMAGIKVHYMNQMYVTGHEANDNFAIGFWYDLQCRGVVMENSVIANNFTFGVFYEVCYGDPIFRNLTLRGNVVGLSLKGSGGYIPDTAALVEGCTFDRNASAVAYFAERRSFSNESIIAPLRYWDNIHRKWTFRNNHFISGYNKNDEFSFQRSHLKQEYLEDLGPGSMQTYFVGKLIYSDFKANIQFLELENNNFEFVDGNSSGGFEGPSGLPDLDVNLFEQWIASIRKGENMPDRIYATLLDPVLGKDVDHVVMTFEKGTHDILKMSRLTYTLTTHEEAGNGYYSLESGVMNNRFLVDGSVVSKLRLSGRIRVHKQCEKPSVWRGASIRFSLFDGRSQYVAQSKPLADTRLNPVGWIELSGEIDVPPQVRSIVVSAGNFSITDEDAMYADFDDLGIEVIGRR
jgi:hypothetical protein